MKQFIFSAAVALCSLTAVAQDAEVKRMKDESNKTIKKEPEQKRKCDQH